MTVAPLDDAEMLLKIEEMIGVLKRFQASPNKREQQVYVCMVHNLFDEYRYFPKYPDKPLRTTAILFGAVIFIVRPLKI